MNYNVKAQIIDTIKVRLNSRINFLGAQNLEI